MNTGRARKFQPLISSIILGACLDSELTHHPGDITCLGHDDVIRRFREGETDL